jgi:hypothetical protein
MRVLVAVFAAAVAGSVINMAGPTGRSAAEDMMELSLREHDFRADLMPNRMTDSQVRRDKAISTTPVSGSTSTLQTAQVYAKDGTLMTS